VALDDECEASEEYVGISIVMTCREDSFPMSYQNGVC
jgi:hypothetical protein